MKHTILSALVCLGFLAPLRGALAADSSLPPAVKVVTYYSSHEKEASGKTITAVYLAELELVQ